MIQPVIYWTYASGSNVTGKNHIYSLKLEDIDMSCLKDQVEQVSNEAG